MYSFHSTGDLHCFVDYVATYVVLVYYSLYALLYNYTLLALNL